MIRFLLDENVALKIKEGLIQNGFNDVKHINDFGKGLKDNEVFKIAKEENRILLSGDDDFKAKNFKYNCGIIWMTPKARMSIENILKKVKWIVEHISNFNINIYEAFISITVDMYNIYYLKGMNKRPAQRTIEYKKIKEFKED